MTSYGGNLIYTVEFEVPRNEESSGTVFSDVRLEGANMTIVHMFPEQPVQDRPLTVVLDIIEVRTRLGIDGWLGEQDLGLDVVKMWG